MKQNGIIKTLLCLIFVIVFNIIFFILGGTSHEASVWIAYGFIHLFYIMCLVTIFFAGHNEFKVVLNMPLNVLSFGFFAVDFVIGLVIILIKPTGYKGCLVFEIIWFGIYLIMFFSGILANDATAQQHQMRQIERRYVNECSARLKGLMELAKDRETERKIQKTYDYIHTSQVKSNDQVMEYEIEVIRLIGVLESNVIDQNAEEIDKTLEKIMTNAGKRNRILMSGQ